MKPVAMLLAALLTLQPALVLARDRYRLPEGKRLTVNQDTYQGYTLEEMKLLLKMDVDLEFFSAEIPKYSELLNNQSKLAINLREQLDSKDETIKILYHERQRLTEKWTEENKLRHEAENRVPWSTWIAWGSAGVMTVVCAVLAGMLIADSGK